MTMAYGTNTSASMHVFVSGWQSRVVGPEAIGDIAIGDPEPLGRPLHSQAYFWQALWQVDEERAERERDAGEGMVFDNAEDAISWLKQSKD